MRIRKITTGFVIQVFDTLTNTWVEQNFTAADQVEFEDMDGNMIDIDTEEFEPFEKYYLPFDMVQPNSEPTNIPCPMCGLDENDNW